MKKTFCLILLPLAVICAGCSVNVLVANALTGEGSSTVFTGDSDPQLVGDALPFAIKMYEALLDATPKHQGLMLTTGSLFVMYANAFVQGPSEILPPEEWEARNEGLMRAKKLYLRGCDILYTALDLKYKGFAKAAQDGNIQTILGKCKKEDVGLLYWAAAGGLSAYSIDILDFELSGRIPEWSAMIKRAYALDPDYGGASMEELMFLFYVSMPEMLGGEKEMALKHFNLALEKSKGNSAGAYVSYAQTICVPAQDYDLYREYLEKALALDPNADASSRLVNIINQKKAKWLLDNAYLNFSFLPIPDYY